MILLDETAEGGGETGSIYLRPTDGSPAIRLGDGSARSISPDGQWVIRFSHLEPGQATLDWLGEADGFDHGRGHQTVLDARIS